jgi:aminomethyltransferase
MNWQAKLVLSGEDRVRWLNGMVTNNVRDLALNHGNMSFLLSPQGHNQGELMAYNRGDYVLVTTDREQAPRIAEVFERYIIMDDVEVGDISDKLATVGVAGPKAAEALAAAGIDVAGIALGEVRDLTWNDVGISVARSSQPLMDSYEIWFAPTYAEQVWSRLEGAGAVPVGSEAVEWYRLARGVPRYKLDLRERDLPQETAQDYVLNFSKGCYVGQEIVERIRSRGNVHRTLAGFEVEGEAPAAGTKVMSGDKPVGEITSASRIPFPGGERTLALGYLRRESAEPGTTVRVGEQSATVQALPFRR